MQHMPQAGKGYWPGTGDLLVAFIFSFKVPEGPRVLILLIDHIAAGGVTWRKWLQHRICARTPHVPIGRSDLPRTLHVYSQGAFIIFHHYHHEEL